MINILFIKALGYVSILHNTNSILNFFLKSSNLFRGNAKFGILIFIFTIIFTVDVFYWNNSFNFSELSILPIFNVRSLLLKFINSIESFFIPLWRRLKLWTSESKPDMAFRGVKSFGKNTDKISISVLNPENDLEVLLNKLFNFLNTLDIFTSVSHKKILITAVDHKNVRLTLNKAVAVNNNTTFETLYSAISETVVRKNISNYKYDEEDDMYHGSDVNVAIASAITAGARMYMTDAKNNSAFNLYYSDTDSIVIDHPLPEKSVGSGLGQLKLECEIERAVFLAPKVYGLVTIDGKEIIKVKGLTHKAVSDVRMYDLFSLLKEDSSMEFTQDKWMKKIIEGNITINQVMYQLKVTSSKREAIYVNGYFSNTRPYNYNDII